MKKLLLIAGLLFSDGLFSQSSPEYYLSLNAHSRIDSLDKNLQLQSAHINTLLEQSSLSIERLDHIQYNLNRCHEQYKKGIASIAVGTAFQIVGVLVLTSNTDQSVLSNSISIFAIGIGTIFTTAGTINIIDSHRFIGQASLRSDGLTLSVNF